MRIQIVSAFVIVLLAHGAIGQTGVEKSRWKDIGKEVRRVMQRGDYETRTARIAKLAEDPHPLAVRIIADGLAISHKRSSKNQKELSELHERNADLHKRLKIPIVQEKGGRTKNKEINANMDRIDALRKEERLERRFRRETMRAIQKVVAQFEEEERAVLAKDLLGEWKRAKGEAQIAVVGVLAQIPLEQATETALQIAKSNKNQLLRLSAIDGLGLSDQDAAANGLVPFLKDPRWQIKVAVIDALKTLRRKMTIPHLIEAMAREEGRVREDVHATLKELTGVQKADNPAVWTNWWKANRDKEVIVANKRGKRNRGRNAGAPAAGGGGGTSFYGITTKSTHIVYILDHSGSMDSPAGDATKTGGGGQSGLTKFEVARNELLKSVDNLPADATFNILFYADDYTVFRDKMVKATKSNKRAAHDYVGGITPKGSTNIYDTLERAFQIGGQGAVDRAYKVAFDTIFFLTDGSPTSGKTTDTEEILSEVKRWNLAKRIKVHAIGIGAHNGRFLQKLAAQTGGNYVKR